MTGDRPVSRRTVLATIGAGVAGGAAGPATAESESVDGHELLAFEHDATDHPERIALAVETRNGLGLENGDQLRIECEDCTDTLGDGIATIGVGLKRSRGPVVGMETEAAARLEFVEDGQPVEEIEGSEMSIVPYGPHPEYDTRSAADEHDEFVETLEDDGTASELAVTAPHGTWIEFNTEKQADRVYERIDVDAVSWTCVGHNTGGGAYDRWHVTSTDISRNSFPKLDRIADRGFDHAVSFHGFSGRDCFDEDVVVGGAAPEWLKERFRDEIETRTDFDVLVTGVGDGSNTDHDCESEPYPGTSPNNFVNWLTDDGESGVQLEQSSAVRRDGNWQEIADIVVDVYEDVI